MTKKELQAFREELGGLTVEELNARNELLEAERIAVREKQLALVAVRATRLRADRVAEADRRIKEQGMRPAQHVKPGAAEVRGTVVR